MKFLSALQFLPTIPVPSRRDLSGEAGGGGTAYFPVVGLTLGLILAGLNWLLSVVLPTGVVDALLIVSLAMLTGALHLDGFLDTCDGMAGHRTTDERLRIMHDSRAGGIGVIAAIILLLVKYVSLSNIPGQLMMPSLLLMPVVSRWAMVYSIFAYPYARASGLGKAFKDSTNWPKFLAATLTTVAVVVVMPPLLRLSGLATMLGVWVMTLIVNAYFKSRLSGLTGDTYGAVNELAEVTVLILVILLARLGLS